MGRVLEFKNARISVTAASDATAAAEIVIFPGVRIERRGLEAGEQEDRRPSDGSSQPGPGEE